MRAIKRALCDVTKAQHLCCATANMVSALLDHIAAAFFVGLLRLRQSNNKHRFCWTEAKTKCFAEVELRFSCYPQSMNFLKKQHWVRSEQWKLELKQILQKEVRSDSVIVIKIMVPEGFESRACRKIAYLNQLSEFWFPSFFIVLITSNTTLRWVVFWVNINCIIYIKIFNF